jgi:hypothetical protein
VGAKADPVWSGIMFHLPDLIPDGIDEDVVRVPRERIFRGRYVHRGWSWVCPSCRQRVQIIYYPLRLMTLPELLGMEKDRDENDQMPTPEPAFACVRCHGVRYFSRVDKNSWNELVHHLSGGLLYGYEVKKPEWLTEDRKHAFGSKIGRPPSKRREEVLERLLRGWKDRQIAKDLGISYHRTRNLVSVVLKQHRAKGRGALIHQLRPEVASPRVASSSRPCAGTTGTANSPPPSSISTARRFTRR